MSTDQAEPKRVRKAPGLNKWKRSSRACVTCRARKVRCDMQTYGTPCSNCRHTDTPCVPAENNRKKKISKSRCHKCHARLRRDCLESDASESPFSSSPKDSDHEIDSQNTADVEDESPRTSLDGLSNDQRSHHGASDDQSQTWAFLRYPNLDQDDQDYLRRKGVFRVPEPSLRNPLLTSYSNWVHPQLPCLDLQGLLHSVSVIDEVTPKISLLLFQAILFAGLAYVDETILHRHGYASRIQAQDLFFERVKLLHQFDTEPELLAVAQACLLLSVNHQCSKTSAVWLTHSHLAAQRLGLENRTAYALMNPDRAAVCRRLWWAIFLRDSTLRLELGTPQRFQDISYDLPPLTMDCFDLSDFSPAVQAAFPDVGFVDHYELHRQLMTLVVHRAELACHLAQILACERTSIPQPFRSQAISIYFEQGLQNWCTDFQHSLQSDLWSGLLFEYHCGLLSILYFSASNTLLQHHLQSPTATASTTMTDGAVRSKMEKDTRKILNIARSLYQVGATFPPTLGMGMVYNAVRTYVGFAESRRARKADPLPLEVAVRCLCALIKTTPRHDAVQVALCHLENRVKMLDVAEPARPLSPSVTPSIETSIETFPVDAASVPLNPQLPTAWDQQDLSIDEWFDMAIRSDRDFSPQPGFADMDGDIESKIQGEDGDVSDKVYDDVPQGILIPV